MPKDERGFGVALVARRGKLQPAGQLGVDGEPQRRIDDRKEKELAAPADCGKAGAGERRVQPVLRQVAHDDGTAGRQHLHAFDELAGHAPVEHLADDLKFG